MGSALIARSALRRGAAVLPLLLPRRAGCVRLLCGRRPACAAPAATARSGSGSLAAMEKSLFRYIWRHSRRDQLIISMVVLASLPFYFASLDLPKRIVNEAI